MPARVPPSHESWDWFFFLVGLCALLPRSLRLWTRLGLDLALDSFVHHLGKIVSLGVQALSDVARGRLPMLVDTNLQDILHFLSISFHLLVRCLPRGDFRVHVATDSPESVE